MVGGEKPPPYYHMVKSFDNMDKSKQKMRMKMKKLTVNDVESFRADVHPLVMLGIINDGDFRFVNKVKYPDDTTNNDKAFAKIEVTVENANLIGEPNRHYYSPVFTDKIEKRKEPVIFNLDGCSHDGRINSTFVISAEQQAEEWLTKNAPTFIRGVWKIHDHYKNQTLIMRNDMIREVAMKVIKGEYTPV